MSLKGILDKAARIGLDLRNAGTDRLEHEGFPAIYAARRLFLWASMRRDDVAVFHRQAPRASTRSSVSCTQPGKMAPILQILFVCSARMGCAYQFTKEAPEPQRRSVGLSVRTLWCWPWSVLRNEEDEHWVIIYGFTLKPPKRFHRPRSCRVESVNKSPAADQRIHCCQAIAPISPRRLVPPLEHQSHQLLSLLGTAPHAAPP